MSDEPPTFHAASCNLEGCDFTTLRTSMVELIGDLEDHLKEEHDYTEEEWKDARDRLAEAGA